MIHVGARGFSNSTTSARNAFELGFKWISAEEFRRRGVMDVVDECVDISFGGTERVYLTVDVDVADATVAPGTQTPRPGGLFSGDLMQLVRNLSHRGCSGFEVVEVAPGADVRGETALLGAALVMECLAGQAARAASLSST